MLHSVWQSLISVTSIEFLEVQQQLNKVNLDQNTANGGHLLPHTFHTVLDGLGPKGGFSKVTCLVFMSFSFSCTFMKQFEGD